jgi:hypothetical protein
MDRKRIENSEGDQRRRTKTERLNQSQETFTDFTKKLDFNSLAKDLKKRVANLLPEVLPRPKDLGPRPGNHGGRPSMLPLPSSAPSSPASSRPRAEMAGYEGLAAALLGGFLGTRFRQPPRRDPPVEGSPQQQRRQPLRHALRGADGRRCERWWCEDSGFGILLSQIIWIDHNDFVISRNLNVHGVVSQPTTFEVGLVAVLFIKSDYRYL